MKGGAAFLVALLFLSSCAAKQVVETGKGECALVQALYRYNQTVHALEGEGIGIYRDTDNTLSFRTKVTAFWPEMNLRLHIQDFVFKKPLLTLVKEGAEVKAALHTRKQYLVVDYRNADFADLTGFNIPKEIVIPTLMGKVYVESPSDVSIAGPHTLEMSGTSVTGTISFDGWRPSRIRYRFPGETFTVTFGKFVPVEGGAFPQKISMESEEGRGRLEITYSSSLLNRGAGRSTPLLPEEIEGYERVFGSSCCGAGHTLMCKK